MLAIVSISLIIYIMGLISYSIWYDSTNIGNYHLMHSKAIDITLCLIFYPLGIFRVLWYYSKRRWTD